MAGPTAGADAASGAGDRGGVERLLEQAAGLTLRAPELALVLGERAAALAEAAGSNELWVRAEGLVVLASVRLGVRAPTVGRAVAALRAAEDSGQEATAAQLRTDLALCARSVGLPLAGLAALRPVLATRAVRQSQRALALCQLVGCLGPFGRKPELDRALLEADRLCLADEALDDDTRLLSRALLRVGVSAHRRRHGDLMGAADAARTGIGFLDDLADKSADGGVVRVRLVLALVCSLLDRGNADTAVELAQPILDEPHRAAGVAPAGWLRLAVATRVYLPEGSGEAAARLLRDALHSSEAHGLHALSARLWLELAYVEEQLDRPAEAVRCLRRSRAAEHTHARARRQACAVLAGEFGTGEQPPVDLDELLAPTVSAPAPRAAERSAAVAPVLQLASEQVAPEPRHETAPAVTSREPARAGEAERWRLRTDPARAADARVADSEGWRPRGVSAPAGATTTGGRRSRPESLEATGAEPWRSRDELAEPVGPEPWRAQHDTAPSRAAREVEPPTEPWRRSGADEPAWERRFESETRPITGRSGSSGTSTSTTRHDAEHGSVTARSVLDRLGISTSGSGGRRRASESDEPGRDDRVHTGERTHTGYGLDRPSTDWASADWVSADRLSAQRDHDDRDSADRSDRGRFGRDQDSADRFARERDSGDRGDEWFGEDRFGAGLSDGGRFGADRPSGERLDDEWSRGDAGVDRSGSRRSRDERAREPGFTFRTEAEPSGRWGTGSPEPTERDDRGPEPATEENDTWLPRLRLPPSLAPMDDLDFTFSAVDPPVDPPPAETGSRHAPEPGRTAAAEYTRAREHRTAEDAPSAAPDRHGDSGFGGADFSDSGFTDSGTANGAPDHSAEPEPTGYDFPLDDPPPGAGLAELLARALAEHKAGTSSAAALVKRLGAQQTDLDGPRRVNGRHRDDD
ncbi:hypothetical protein [Amycolatopsis arida]|uniref:hypothetical protein n=1 Tax=Amycolatopsis arida TaxID=587909 RepID=UPI000B86F53E|nr:hypothetical protein [Amycolatopsis arida]